jgi:hypothetical protein
LGIPPGKRAAGGAFDPPGLLQGEIDEDLLKRLDDCHRKEDDPPSRPEAIRRLVGLGLKAKSKI